MTKTVFLKDYQLSDYLINTVHLSIDLLPKNTIINSLLQLERNTLAEGSDNLVPLVLNAEEMQVSEVCINEQPLILGEDYTHENDLLTVLNPQAFYEEDCFDLYTKVTIQPQDNTSLMGLYQSRTMFCSQCEAEGFRKITPYLDRPDVMAVFTVEVVADKTLYPVLLSNGNLIESKELEHNRHSNVWHDPFPKPAYLFAVVAGNLACIEDQFSTMSGRDIEIKVYVEEKDSDKCEHAIGSLKRAMLWDEQTYGREYDLDIFMLVAVDDFNMGAMENKGLNIFNTSAILANQQVTSDMRFQWVEKVVAHEYFHNWSGNRVTCRDWFQLSLKEGLTVYRDAQFSCDMGSPAVKRVQDVMTLKEHQFAEDAGPLAHPVQPDSYQEINNFYTLTVYEKGAEIVGMQANMLGKENYRKATDYYFDTFDGQAATIEDFVGSMEKISDRNLSQFKLWYKQAGTPRVQVTESYDEAAQTYQLDIEQSCPATAECQNKKPFLIPIKLGLLGANGALPLFSKNYDLNGEHEAVIEITQQQQSVMFEQVSEKPVPSLFRGFSAPIKLQMALSQAQLCRIVQSDSDDFNRWDAMQRLAFNEIENGLNAKQVFQLSASYTDTFASLLADTTLELGFKALILKVPSMEAIAERHSVLDIDTLYELRIEFIKAVAARFKTEFKALYHELNVDQAFSTCALQVGQRSLKNCALSHWVQSEDKAASQQCLAQFQTAKNMTEQSAALVILVNLAGENYSAIAAQALEDFYQQWQDESLVVTQWLAIQASSAQHANLDNIKRLMQHKAFDLTNPNKARSLIGSFCGLDPHNFHHNSGNGYAFVGEQVRKMNAINPQIASRLVVPLTKWQRMDVARGEMMQQQLRKILTIDRLSPDLHEMVNKSLNVETAH